MNANTTTARTPGPTAGSVITARPWRGGEQMDETDGIVLVEHFADDAALVWFPTLDGGEIVTGSSVQPIFYTEVMSGALDLSVYVTAYVEQVRAAYRAAVDAGVWVWDEAGADIDRAAEQVADRG